MNAKRLLLISCIAALALPASVANGQRRGGGGGRAHVGSMQARSAPSGAYRGTYGGNWSGRNWNGRNWSGRNWSGRNWNGNWGHHHGHNSVVFIGDFGFPGWWGWGWGYPGYYGYGYPYGYYGYGYPYGYGYGYGDYGYGYGYSSGGEYSSPTRSRV